MLKIESLRRKRAEVNVKVQALANQEGDAELSSEQLTEFEELQNEFESISAQIKVLEDAEKMNAQHAVPIKENRVPAVHVKQSLNDYPGAKLARLTMAVAASGGNVSDAVKFAQSEIGDNDVTMALEAGGSGAALVPKNWSAEVIDLLRPRTITRKLGARSVDLVNGNMTMPKLTGGATTSFIGEGGDVLASEQTLGDVELQAKTMITLVPISNQLIGRSGYQTEQLVLSDMIQSIAVRADKAYLRDDGTSNTPTGFKKVAETNGRTIAWSGTADLATIDAYLDSLILGVEQTDSLMISPGWGLSPRSAMKLSGLRDGNGNKVYPEMAQGILKGYPFAKTTTIPVNLGSGTNETEIYFADFNDVLIGEGENMTVDFSKEATYKDASGNLVSAFSRNQSVIRVVSETDVGFRHNEGIIMGKGVTW